MSAPRWSVIPGQGAERALRGAAVAFGLAVLVLGIFGLIRTEPRGGIAVTLGTPGSATGEVRAGTYVLYAEDRDVSLTGAQVTLNGAAVRLGPPANYADLEISPTRKYGAFATVLFTGDGRATVTASSAIGQVLLVSTARSTQKPQLQVIWYFSLLGGAILALAGFGAFETTRRRRTGGIGL